MKVLILANPRTLHISYVKDYMRSFELYSEHEIHYAAHVPHSDLIENSEYYSALHDFDVVVVTFHLRVCFDDWISPGLNRALKEYSGGKVLFLHDEYDRTEITRRWIEEQEIDLVYSAVPAEYVKLVYPPERFPKTHFETVLTGYAPIRVTPRSALPGIAERPYHVVYRGRQTPPWLGELARQKEEIGRYIQQVCRERNLPHDIGWNEQERLFGLDWQCFLQTGRVTLGTESGANVFDESGAIRKYYEEQGWSGKGPGEIKPPIGLNFQEGNIGVRMNQVSPRLFEAVANGTALVLYRGTYSGILQADRHYVPLELDHGNIDRVIETIEDAASLQAMADRAYDEIIQSSRYDYANLVRKFDQDLSELPPRTKETYWETDLPGPTDRESRGTGEIIAGDFSDLSASGVSFYLNRAQGLRSILDSKQESLADSREKLRLKSDKLAETRSELKAVRQRLATLNNRLQRQSRELGEIKNSRAYKVLTLGRRFSKKPASR